MIKANYLLFFCRYHIPCVTLIKWDPLEEGKESKVEIMLMNPVPRQTTISFLPHDAPDEETSISEAPEPATSEVKLKVLKVTFKEVFSEANGRKSVLQETPQESLSTMSSLPRIVGILEAPRPVNVPINADVKLPPPDTTITIPARDDAAEYEEAVDTQTFEDDPK